MPAERHDGDLGIDYSEIELRVLAFMSDHGADRRHRTAARERTVNALMTPTGRRRYSPEIINV